MTGDRVDTTADATDLETSRWGREVTQGTVAGHPSLVYARRPRSVAELLVDARRWRDRTAVVEGLRRLSFHEFEQAVARVSRKLATDGVKAGDRVVLLGYNSLEWIAAFWALQALGAVAVLGNAWWSDDETAAAIALIEPAALITDRSGERASAGSFRSIALASLREIVDASHEVVALEVAAVDEDQPAIIMFSSGTTGAAKGVVISHRSSVANIHNLLVLTGRLPDEIDADRPGTVSLLTVPLFHLAGVQISFSTLLSGGTLVLLEGRFDPEAVLRLIEREKVRAWGSIPTMVSRVVDHERFADFDTSSLKSIPMGGAAISPDLRAKVAAAFPSVSRKVGSLYGLTEAGGVLAAGSGPELQGRPQCVGRPLPVVEVRIGDADASGVGEIMARTPTMTSGYWRDPTPIVDAEGWLKTGDLGRIDADGLLYVTGRSKDIIIRGGENIASQHVEHRLLEHPDVLEVAVVALPHADLGEEVAAAVVLKPSSTLNAGALRLFAAEHLGKFEVPTRWWFRTERLPVNASGKIIKRDVVSDWKDAPCT